MILSPREVQELYEGLKLAQKLSENRMEEIASLRQKIKIADIALDDIAAWDEGQVVSGKFDEPSSAIKAREALSKIREVNHEKM